jgi:hypothetical protein
MIMTTTKPEVKPPVPKGWPRAPEPEAFHGPAGQLVRAISPESETDPVALLAQALVAFGNCIGRTAHFRVEADVHYGNLFICLVGDTSKGRKGTSWGHVRKVYEGLDKAWTTNCVKTGLSTGEGLLHAIRDGKRDDEPEEAEADDLGDKEAGDPGVRDKRLLALESEFATILKHAERRGNILTNVLRQCWDAPPVRETLTKSSPVRVTGAHVSIIGHVTAEEEGPGSMTV